MARLEIELKFTAPADATTRIAALGATARAGQTETDHYFNAPDRDFAATNEAFRIRRVGDGSTLTYKGPRLQGPAKTRQEIEAPLQDGNAAFDAATSLFTSLGYRPVAVVKKNRSLWSLTRGGFELTISLDDVEDVGQFMEVEIVADDARKTEAEAVLLGVTGELCLAQPEHQSYLTMLLQKRVS